MMISDDDLFKDPLPKEDCPICYRWRMVSLCVEEYKDHTHHINRAVER